MKHCRNGVLLLIFLLVLLASGCSSEEKKSESPKELPSKKAVEETPYEFTRASAQQIEHIQGIGYPGNDTGLYLSSSDGLKLFKDGAWHETSTQHHNYMGFQAVKDGYIASGHPDEDSDLKDPLGIVKSTDKGKTIEGLMFYGESTFPFLSAGYNTGIIYIINQEENTELDAGVYRSENEGQIWDPVSLKGLDADTLGMIAAHPDYANIMAMSTRSGIFFSRDKGETVDLVSEPIMATALAFTEDSLYYAFVEQEKVLLNKVNLETMETSTVEIPFLSYDNPITYIAADYNNSGRLAFSTYLKDLYESADSGETWELLLKNGRIK
ncbi:hypothetical protein J7I93_07405 [Bacillus sp. ISL-47]|uniref:F510_1955 family glycosylhydrolase n=1 Tax=Bacillus sp. ISL-47 TaxID=2819130 RepID=UPI001BEC7CAD|nr:hypothetical protein [Bacillus sp. ISL-47]MBT2688004.1 hypothetical protein [Bacillus sp. ISL-47]MBT2707986.1 hypothetical protein [Pseudomonas sp. ISL-84]